MNSGHLAAGVASLYKDGVFKKKKLNKVIDFNKLENYKKIFNLNNIDFHIIFLITKISRQQYYTSDLLEIWVLNSETYQRSQYQIENKLKDVWLFWETNNNWEVYINILQFLSKFENSTC